MFSTFLRWLLADPFHEPPEIGDPEKPKLVFFFDEAHLLFTGASKAFLEQVTQTIRLIRSKGVGIFFVTQVPADVPDSVLGQLGNRVQHALRAFTPDDATNLARVTSTPLQAKYGTAVDRESAYEKLAAKLAPAQTAGQDAPAAEPERQAPAPQRKDEGGVVSEVLKSSAFKSFARSAATVLGREITRSTFGTARRRR
jgi:hypothetical protein